MSADDLSKMIPANPTITVGAEQVTIKNLKVGKLTQVVAAIQPFAHLLPKPGNNPTSHPIDYFELVINHTDSVIDFTALILDKDPEWVKDLDVDQLVDILSAIVEVNLDFFIQKVLPSVSRAMVKLGSGFSAKARALSGQSPSNG